ncbi:MAG: SOS response-associated peptidase [Rhodospirillaceae bacterium]|nr:SOS response-associated peptidase [Rhodospirillales bacterium]
MCGRFASTTPPEAMAKLFGTVNAVPNGPARWNVAPTQDVLTVRFNPKPRQRSLDLLRWGLIPHWAKDASMGNKLVNARAEGIADKPAFRDAIRRRRCLIPADAFYEWRPGAEPKAPKQPYAIQMADGRPFAIAGLWENWKDPEGHWLRTCTIITTAANELVARLHDRMPVILAPADYGRWLGDEPAEPGDVLGLLRPYPTDLMTAYPVSREVSNVRNEGPQLLEPIGR